jgi:hypothetical protein
MRKYFLIFLLFIFALPIIAENVTNVRVRQEGKTMVITYDLKNHADIRLLMIYDGLNNFRELKKTKGDVGKGVLSGQDRTIIWEVLEEYEKFIAKGVRFKVEEAIQSKYKYVDLGLSVKWATCNVGATKPEEIGHYFAWGETKPKYRYDWSTYKYCFNGSKKKITKYNIDPKYGNQKYVDNDTVLDLSDDAAYVNWGGSWRMPTDKEWLELLRNCTITFERQNGVWGHKATSKKNGNSIFFIGGSGYRFQYKTENTNFGQTAYWSSSQNRIGPKHPAIGARSWLFMQGYEKASTIFHMYDQRCYGCLVRPVCP